MVKNKQNSEEDLSMFFEAAKSSPPESHQDLKVRILKDADKAHEVRYLPRPRSWLAHALDHLKELGRIPSAAGFATSLAAGVCIGLYVPDLSEPIAIVFQIDTFNEVDFTGSFFGINEIFEGT